MVSLSRVPREAWPPWQGGGSDDHRADGLYASRAVLVFGDFSERIELRVRQHIRGRLRKSERDEDQPGRDRAVDASLEADRSATSRDLNELARSRAQPLHIAGRHAGDRLRFEI